MVKNNSKLSSLRASRPIPIMNEQVELRGPSRPLHTDPGLTLQPSFLSVNLLYPEGCEPLRALEDKGHL